LTSSCRTTITEAIQTASSTNLSVTAGNWGCEVATGSGTKFVDTVDTTTLGIIKVKTTSAFGDTDMNAKIVTLAPMINGVAVAATDGQKVVTSWRCGATGDGTDSTILKYLPGSCKGNL